MRDISAAYLTKNTKNFFKDQWEESDIELLYNDAAKLAIIGQYMIEGNFDAAMSVASEVDTIVRDEIPKSIWNYLEKYTLDRE